MSEINGLIMWFSGLTFDMQIILFIVLMALILARVGGKKAHR